MRFTEFLIRSPRRLLITLILPSGAKRWCDERSTSVTNSWKSRSQGFRKLWMLRKQRCMLRCGVRIAFSKIHWSRAVSESATRDLGFGVPVVA